MVEEATIIQLVSSLPKLMSARESTNSSMEAANYISHPTIKYNCGPVVWVLDSYSRINLWWVSDNPIILIILIMMDYILS